MTLRLGIIVEEHEDPLKNCEQDHDGFHDVLLKIHSHGSVEERTKANKF